MNDYPVTRDEVLLYIRATYADDLAVYGFTVMDSPESVSYIIDDALRLGGSDGESIEMVADRQMARLFADLHDRLGVEETG